VVANLMPPPTTIGKRDTFPDKPAAYQALSDLNLHFEESLQSLKRLTALGVFKSRGQRESAEICRVSSEETRAWINFEATESLHDGEERDWARFGRLRHRYEKKNADPQDVLILAGRLRRTNRKSATKER
jgi:hypothetical protein